MLLYSAAVTGFLSKYSNKAFPSLSIAINGSPFSIPLPGPSPASPSTPTLCMNTSYIGLMINPACAPTAMIYPKVNGGHSNTLSDYSHTSVHTLNLCRRRGEIVFNRPIVDHKRDTMVL